MKKNSIHILFASRLVVEKGVDILIDVIKKSEMANSEYGTIFWSICSDGEFSSEIQELAKHSNGRVIYYGKIQAQELANLYRKSDFLLMPSRFLETFGLTALESLACGTRVIGFRKGGLTSFVSSELALDRDNPTDSFFSIIQSSHSAIINVSKYSSSIWKEKLEQIFPDERIALIHDYHEKIGGAEYYIESLEEVLGGVGKNTSRFSYTGKTFPWKRRFLFMFSIFAFWRYISIARFLSEAHPEVIWIHSVIRYIGFWGLLAIRDYAKKNAVQVYLSHHDVGLLAPFPQSVTEEEEIPASFFLRDFVAHVSGFRKVVATVKWFYIWLYRKILPRDITHILFASFMESHIKNHFGKNASIILLPHAYDEKIFHP